jgi:hypothetical protein
MALKRSVLRADSIQMGVLASPSETVVGDGDDVLYDSPTSAWYSAINGWPAKSVTTAASAR